MKYFAKEVLKGKELMFKKIYNIIAGIFKPAEEGGTPRHYRLLRRNIIIIMIGVTIMPLALMAIFNFYQYRASLKSEMFNPMNSLTNKTKHSFELFLEERLSTVRFIASAYTYEELLNKKNMNKIFRILKKEIGGFVDLGLINSDGILVSYAGPYSLLGKDYSQQSSFQEVLVKGKYISDVFMGHRKFPHIIISVQHLVADGKSCVLRATIDTDMFDKFIASMGVDHQSDAFLVNSKGILQTGSKYYGKVLEPCRLKIPPGGKGSYVIENVDQTGKEILIAFAAFSNADYKLVLVKPRAVVLKSWYTLKTEILVVFFGSAMLISMAIFKITNRMVKRIKRADARRAVAFRELQHNQKLSSIGRLAAGVAHEINNPLAIINEKAGLMNDLILYAEDFGQKEKFTGLIESILKSIDRCRTITHRLLGFARKVDMLIEPININNVINDVLGFLEREALLKKLDVRAMLSDKIKSIASDRGQLQQVFLNLITNAFAAVEEGGMINIKTMPEEKGGVIITVEDNGCGMSEEVIKHIFDPFFTTKKGTGTGLGLSITYGIIHKMGGDIKLRSEKGKGTLFTVMLPEQSEISPGTDEEKQNEGIEDTAD